MPDYASYTTLTREYIDAAMLQHQPYYGDEPGEPELFCRRDEETWPCGQLTLLFIAQQMILIVEVLRGNAQSERRQGT
jgi:hypothetical protein